MADNGKKVLLHLDNVKMHFPIKKESLLQKEQLAVKAVDGITLDIYQGETLGLVGESGCGKSTLGRLILQLYKPTEGKVYYHGLTLDDFAPAYVRRVIQTLPAIRDKGPEQLLASQDSAVKILGGLLLDSDLSGLKDMLDSRFQVVGHRHKAIIALELFRFKLEAEDEAAKTDKGKSQLAGLEQAVAQVSAQLAEKDRAIEARRDKLKALPGYDTLENSRTKGIDLSQLTKEEMRRLRRYLQVVFQDPYSSLNPRLTVGNLISEALVAHNIFPSGSSALEEYTLKVMDDCGLQKYMIHRYPHQFSGGQRQRIGIARALALAPAFVVCDEAVSALDVSIQSQVINLLIDLKEKKQLTYLFISHDLSTVKFISDRVGVMYLGNIIELGQSHAIYQEPLHPYTQALLEAIPTTEEGSNKEIQILEGDIPSPIRPPKGCKFHTRCKYATDRCKAEYPQWRELRPSHYVACHYPLIKDNANG